MLFYNREININLYDADDVEKLENAVQAYTERVSGQQDGESTPAYIRRMCDCVYHFFDTVGGAGTADALFERDDILDCAEKISEFLNLAREEQAENEQRIQTLFPARSQATNRAQRRTRP